jgi:23S rRNA pseudouridine2605 synthase
LFTDSLHTEKSLSMERLQKIISAAGVASRRKAEELITAGLVQVNGQTITELGAKADAGKDHIRVNGKLLKFSGHHVYILLNKPKGYVTTLSDPEGRPTIVDLLQGVKQRVYPVGRLDYASEGLLLLTNDGELANALTKAASHVPKTYLVKVSGQPSDAAIEQLRAGIQLPDRKGMKSRTAPAGIELVHQSENPWYEVTLIEGRNRQIRAMFEQTGHHVEKLKRVRYGPFTLDVHPGKHRNLLPEEVEQLRAAVDRGRGATAEASVRPAAPPAVPPAAPPIARAESYIDAELREQERAPKIQPPLAFRDQPKQTARPSGTFAPKPLFGAARPDVSRPGTGRAGKRPGAAGEDKFRKKGPQGVRFGRRDAPFEKRGFESGPRPVRPRGMGGRPDWKKSGPAGSGGPRSAGPRAGVPQTGVRKTGMRKPGVPKPGMSKTGVPGKWEPRPDSANDKPRLFGKAESRPGRPPGAGRRPDWKRPAAAGGGAAGAPRKWTQGAPAAGGRPRAFAPGGKPRLFEKKPGRPGSRPDRPDSRPHGDGSRPDKPFGRARREDSRGERGARPGTRPARPASQRKPFWQGADKRRPRKPREEGDFERSAGPGSRERPGQGEHPRKPQAAGSSRPKFGASRPPSRPSSGPGKKRR